MPEHTDVGESLEAVQLARIEDKLDRLLKRDGRSMWNIEPLAEHIGVSPRTLRDMLRRGVIASFKVEGRRVIHPREVDRYLAVQQAKATASE